MLRTRHTLALVLLVHLAACTSQQLYQTGQTWQRNECRKLAAPEQQRCIDSNAMSWDEYQRQRTAPAKAP